MAMAAVRRRIPIVPAGAGRIPTEFLWVAPFIPLEILCGMRLLWREESSMLDVVFLGGGVLLFCVLIAYERLCNRL